MIVDYVMTNAKNNHMNIKDEDRSVTNLRQSNRYRAIASHELDCADTIALLENALERERE
jgi:hypothetical protein